MSSPQVAVDREIVARSFREWQGEQTLLDAQLAESVAALDAYQAHLDNWQQELVREREELRQLRAAIERDVVAGVGAAGVGAAGVGAAGVGAAGVGVGREQIEHLNKELEGSREKISSNSGPAKVEPRRTTSPVLGSVLEQFSKLREQRSMKRSNNKPR